MGIVVWFLSKLPWAEVLRELVVLLVLSIIMVVKVGKFVM